MAQTQQNHFLVGRASPTPVERDSEGIDEGLTTFRAEGENQLLARKLPFSTIEAYVSRLSQFYAEVHGEAGEHPVYSKCDWQFECGDERRAATDYWTWVAFSIEQDHAMWPWDREAAPAVQISRAAKIHVEQVPGQLWKTKGRCAAAIAHLSYPSELEAWQAAGAAVLKAMQMDLGHSAGELEDLPLTVLTHWISFCTLLAEGDPVEGKALGKMRDVERAGSHWVKVAKAAGIDVKETRQSTWELANGPEIPALCTGVSYPSESAAWRAAAVALLEYLRLHLECTTEEWQSKSPGQHLELAKTFYADYRPPAPDFAFTQHYEHAMKVLCQNVGWRVNQVRTAGGEIGQGWQLNRQGLYPTAADAWIAGADRIRRLVMQRANISYVEWLSLPLDEQISMGLSHAR